MPVGIQITVEGLNELKVLLDVLPQKTREKIELDLRKIVEEIRDEAKQKCPVDTGALQKSIRIQTYSKPAGVMAKLGVSAGGYTVNPKTGQTVNYASFVEYGTSRNPAQPFLRPAYQNKTRQLKNVMKQAVIEVVRTLIH